jgi:hypothetical protein
VTSDDDAEGAFGEFPPGLESLSIQIRRITRRRQDGEDTSKEMDQFAEKAMPFMREARDVLNQAHGDTAALSDRMRQVLTDVQSEAAAALTGTGSLSVGGILLAAAALRGEGTLTAGAVVLPDAGAAVDSLEARKYPSVLDRLPPAYTFYIILVWLLTAGVGVVLKDFQVPPDVLEQIQTDPNYVSLALEVTLLLLAAHKRR